MSDEGHVRYEKTDVQPLALLRVGFILILITIAVVLAVLPFFSWLYERKVAQDPAAGSIPRYEPGRNAPDPRLQGQSNAVMQDEPCSAQRWLSPLADCVRPQGFADVPPLDLTAFRSQQEELATSYGWIDPGEGIVRIPIDRAMRIIAHRGLPSRHDAPVAPEEPQP